jgi:hypothetical protein
MHVLLLVYKAKEFVFPKFNISLPVLTNLFKLLTTPFMQSLKWSITGHERRAAVSAATSTAFD